MAEVVAGALAIALIGIGVVGAVAARRGTRAVAESDPPAAAPHRAPILQRLRERIDPPHEPSPDDWVVIAVVPFAEGPLVHSAIEGAGIAAVMSEVRTLGGRGADMQRIAVRHRDQAEAEKIVRDARGPKPGNGPFIWRG